MFLDANLLDVHDMCTTNSNRHPPHAVRVGAVRPQFAVGQPRKSLHNNDLRGKNQLFSAVSHSRDGCESLSLIQADKLGQKVIPQSCS